MTDERRYDADELAEEGKRLAEQGHPIIFLYPSQEWMAVAIQMPFLRYGKIPEG